MANKTFGDLPKRSNINTDDFFITNRTSETSFPEARTGIDTLKNYLYTDLIVKNQDFISTKVLDVKTTKQSINIQNGTNLITFKDTKNSKKVIGNFQIKCEQTKGTKMGSSVCLYTLSYVPNDKKFTNIVFYDNEILEIGETSNSVMAKTYHNLLITPFVPYDKGFFKLDISFLNTINGAQCTIDSIVRIFETF